MGIAMKIRKQSPRGIIEGDHCRFLVYDETKGELPPTEERLERNEQMTARFTQGMTPDKALEFAAGVAENMKEMDVGLHGVASGRLHLAYFTVYRDGKIGYEWDNAIEYTHDDMKLILRRAHAARKRVRFSEEPTPTN